MAKPSGGRGNKAPYESTHVRVPEPIKAEVERVVDLFRQGCLEEPIASIKNSTEAIAAAKGILRSKRGARECLGKLLTALYDREIKL